MRAEKLNSWIQVVTGIALVISLALVIWELKQGRDVTMAQMTSDGFDQSNQLFLALLGENPSEVLARNCEDPSTLTDSDFAVLAAFYEARLLAVRRPYTIEQRTGLYEDTWESIALGTFQALFATETSEIWWDGRRDSVSEEMRQYGDKILEEPRLRGDCFSQAKDALFKLLDTDVR